jgi:type IV pilus assembly protein PilC
MVTTSAIRLRELADLSGRLAASLEAGVDIRHTLARESTAHVRLRLRAALAEVKQAVDRGSTLAEALDAQGSFFPPLFRQLVSVGEESGKLPDVLRRMAEHYELRLRLRREFFAAIAWPAVQLGLAVGVLGLAILVMGFLPPMPDTGKPFDIFGLGLYGVSGMITFFAIVAGMVVGGVLLALAVHRGLAWTAGVQRALDAVPGLGRALRTLALARLTWALQLTLDAGMDVLRAVPLALRASAHAPYMQHSEALVRALRNGQDLTGAMAATQAFPGDFLDALHVGEESGRLPEQLAVLSRQYQDQARHALSVITQLAAVGVWLMVAAAIVVFIFRGALSYINIINGAVRDTMRI